MANIFFGLNIGRSSLLAHQVALDVTGHNLSNVNTEGYSRQRVSLTQSLPIQTPQGAVGSGVDMDRVQRMQLGYLERQVGKVTSQNAYDAQLVQGLDEVQSLLGEPSSEGVGAALTEFWNSWESLSARPTDASLRGQVLDRAGHLAAVYNQKVQSLADLESGFDEAIAGSVNDLNAWTEKIASLNVRIAQSEAVGYTANDLRDQRELLARQVAGKLGVESETDGSFLNLRVSPDGPYLVNRSDSYKLETVQEAGGATAGFRVGNSPVSPAAGDLAALFELRSSITPDLRGQLSTLMATVSDRVNSLHTAGTDRDGSPGENLFLWQGQAASLTFSSSSGLAGVTADDRLDAGTHYLEVTSVDGLVANGNGNLSQGSITLTQAGVYSGSKTIGLDYHVKILSANNAAGLLDGMKVQLYRGEEAIGEARSVSGAGPATVDWTADGIAFSAAVDAFGDTFAAGERSDGFSTIGTVSLDGGNGVAVNLLTQNNLTFTAGSSSGFTGGGTATVDFSAAAFSRASITRYSADARLEVNPEVASDTDKVAAGGTLSSGDGETARLLGDLASQAIFEDIRETAAGYLGRTVQSLGGKGRDAQIFEKASGAILQQLNAQRQSEAGVNADEEMVQMLQYQRGFEAAARFLTTVDGLIDTLINRVGLAGR